MKTILLFILIVLSASSNAQHFQVSGYAGYSVPASVKGSFGKYQLDEGLNNGVIVSWILPEVNVEMQYNYQSSQLSHNNVELGFASLHTILGGASMDLSKKKIKPFAGMMVGLSVLCPESYTKITRFTLSVLGGAKVELMSCMGLRFQGQVFLPTVYRDPDIGFEPMAAARNGIHSNSIVVCANFSGGIYVNIK